MIPTPVHVWVAGWNSENRGTGCTLHFSKQGAISQAVSGIDDDTMRNEAAEWLQQHGEWEDDFNNNHMQLYIEQQEVRP